MCLLDFSENYRIRLQEGIVETAEMYISMVDAQNKQIGSKRKFAELESEKEWNEGYILTETGKTYAAVTGHESFQTNTTEPIKKFITEI